MKEKYAYVMMIRDKWWREFCNLTNEGKTELSYVKTGLAAPTSASMLFFYVTKPVGEMAGYAEFIERKSGEPESLWNTYGSESALRSKGQYEQLIGDEQKVSFIRFRNLHPVSKPLVLSNLTALLGVKKLARKGFYIDKQTADKLVALMT